MARAAKLLTAPVAPVPSTVGHSEDRGVFTSPCAWVAEGEEQDEGSWHEDLHLLYPASAEGELVSEQGNLYPDKATCLSLPVP